MKAELTSRQMRDLERMHKAFAEHPAQYHSAEAHLETARLWGQRAFEQELTDIIEGVVK